MSAMEQVIVLNKDYTYLNMVSVQKAFRWIQSGKAITEKASDKVLHTVTDVFAIPVVVRLTHMVRQMFRRKVQWSKRNVMVRDSYTCVYCGCKEGLDIDHVTPKSKGGTNAWENTVTSCRPCNRQKADRTLREASMYFKVKGYTPHQPTVMEFIQRFHGLLGITKILQSLGVY